MQGFLGSVRSSLDFSNLDSGGGEPGGGAFGGFAEKINSSRRKTRIRIKIFWSRPGGGGNLRALLPLSKGKDGDEKGAAAAIRWRKGELIGCGAFERVYMGMNLDSGEILAVKQVT